MPLTRKMSSKMTETSDFADRPLETATYRRIVSAHSLRTNPSVGKTPMRGSRTVIAGQRPELMVWTKAHCLDPTLAKAELKRLRYAFLHVAARIVRDARQITLRIQRHWPWEHELVNAFHRLRTIPLC